jgi:hypothetical protein
MAHKLKDVALWKSEEQQLDRMRMSKWILEIRETYTRGDDEFDE